jgi:hypothetical protein
MSVASGFALERRGGYRVEGMIVDWEARMDGWRGEEEMMVMERRWNGVLVPRQI